MPLWPNWNTTVRFSDEGPGVTPLHQSPALKVVLVGLEPGQQLPPHVGPTASFSILDGEGVMIIGDEEVQVAAGAVAVVPGGQIRSVRAVDSRLVFVGSLGDPMAEDPPPGAGG
jgi:quercetin dioxygenase-like cupin family protein